MDDVSRSQSKSLTPKDGWKRMLAWFKSHGA